MATEKIIRGDTWARQWKIKDIQGNDIPLDTGGITYQFKMEDLQRNEVLSLDSGGADAAKFATFDASGNSVAAGPYVRLTLLPTDTQALDKEEVWIRLTFSLSATEVHSSDWVLVSIED